MEVVVINLDSQVHRWNAVSGQLSQVGIQPVRIAAVDASHLAKDRRAMLYSEQLNRLQYHQPLCEGEIACYASHIEVWRRLLRSSAAHVAVLEDDVEVGAELPRVLDAIADMPGEWDMVKLIGRSNEKVAASQPLCEGTALIRYRRVPSLTGAYVIHRRAAEKLLAHRLPFGRPVDVDLRFWWECELSLQGVQPYPVKEGADALSSCIGARSADRTVGMRCWKLWLQLQYTWFNWQAQRAGCRHTPQRLLSPRVAPRGHDGA